MGGRIIVKCETAQEARLLSACDAYAGEVKTLARRIAELEAERASMIDALCKIATGRIGDGWATDRVQWDMCRSIAKVELDARGVTLPAEAAHARAPS